MISEPGGQIPLDAQRAAERIARFASGRGYDDYRADEMLCSAVERQFEIVGEVFVGLRRVDPDLAATIPDLSRIVAFRNVLIHGYTTVDDRLVWGVVEGKLPELLARFTRLLDEAGEGGPGGV